MRKVHHKSLQEPFWLIDLIDVQYSVCSILWYCYCWLAILGGLHDLTSLGKTTGWAPYNTWWNKREMVKTLWRFLTFTRFLWGSQPLRPELEKALLLASTTIIVQVCHTDWNQRFPTDQKTKINAQSQLLLPISNSSLSFGVIKFWGNTNIIGRKPTALRHS